MHSEIGFTGPVAEGICSQLRPPVSTFQVARLILSVVILGCLVGCGGGSGVSTTPPPPPNPVPVISSVSPSPFFVHVPIPGEPAPYIVATGKNFVPSSVVEWNGHVLFTPGNSASSLSAEVDFSDIATPGTATITVVTPSPGGGTSNAVTVPINNAPTITALSPSSAVAGEAAFTLSVTGTNFLPSAVVEWSPPGTGDVGFSPRPTTYVSSTELQAAISASDVAAVGSAGVYIEDNPAGAYGESNAVNFAINNPVPTVTSLNPNSAIAGGAGFTLTVTGTGFIPSSIVQWNGSARTTTFVSSTSLLASIAAADIATGGSEQVSVSSPGPGGGTSGSISFPVIAPTISLLNPSSVVAGGPTFTLTATGTNFVAASVIQFNGTALTTTFVSNTQLQAAVPAANISTAGTANISVANPAASGGVSPAAGFFIGSAGGVNFAVISVSQAAKDIVYDPVNQLFYLSVTSTDATHPNTIAVLDPKTCTVTSWQATGINSNVLAISDDSQLLYVGIDGAVQRFLLPGLVTDISFSLPVDSFGGGPFFALDLQVAPGAPHTTAITLGVTSSTPAAQGGITIFDDGVARPTNAEGFGPGGGSALYDSLQWGSDATALFAANNESTGFDFYTLAVDAQGVVQTNDYPNSFSSFFNRIHFDPGTKLVYSDDGHVIDPSTGKSAGKFNSSGLMVPDSILNKAFFLTNGGTSSVTITSFDLTLFTQIDSITVNNVTGNPQRLIRWGQNGLAFITDGGQAFVIGGSFVH
jgi:hypothetical protein